MVACLGGDLDLSLTELVPRGSSASLSLYKSVLGDSSRLEGALGEATHIVVCNENRSREEAAGIVGTLAGALAGRGGIHVVHAVPLESALGGGDRIDADTTPPGSVWRTVETELEEAIGRLPGSVVRTMVCGQLVGPELDGSSASPGNSLIVDCIEGHTLPHVAFYPTDVRDVASSITHSFYEIQNESCERYVLSTCRAVFPDELSRRLSTVVPHFGIGSQQWGWTTHGRSLWSGRMSLDQYWNSVGKSMIVDNNRARHRLAFFPRRMNTTLKDTVQSLVKRGRANPVPMEL